jgi:hypothetical protein
MRQIEDDTVQVWIRFQDSDQQRSVATADIDQLTERREIIRSCDRRQRNGAKDAIASSKIFACSEFCSIAVKAVASELVRRNAGSPVRTRYSSSFQLS